MKRFITLIAAAALALTACSSGSTTDTAESASSEPTTQATESEMDATTPLKVGFVYVSPLKGSSWTLAWDNARASLESELGAETATVEPVPESAEAKGVIDDLISKGNELIFATAFGYQPFVLEAATANPEVNFVVIGPWIQEQPYPANVSIATSDNWIVRYALGVLAAKSTKTGTLGFVAANPISTVIASINAYALGAQSVDKSIIVKAVFTGTWYDPPRSTQAAEALAAAGADVIAQYEDSTGALLGAEKAGVWGIGSEADTSAFAPKAYLSGSVNNWNIFALAAAQSTADGTWSSQNYVGTLQDGGTSMGPINAGASAEAKAAAEEALAGLTSGAIVPFTGPIRSNDGKLVLPDGEKWADSITVFENSNFLVEGVDGTIPQ
jgi:basic membrane lipoprotein Med (substrate-binding protein (PBP1-ABC) superfamily)